MSIYLKIRLPRATCFPNVKVDSNIVHETNLCQFLHVIVYIAVLIDGSINKNNFLLNEIQF